PARPRTRSGGRRCRRGSCWPTRSRCCARPRRSGAGSPRADTLGPAGPRALASARRTPEDQIVHDAVEAPPGGLSSAEAAARLASDGPNRLPPPRRRSPLRRFVDQLVHFFALMLWGAGALAFVAGQAP